MNGMLQPHDYYQDGVTRRQREARDWARAEAMGRAARSNRRRPARAGHAHRHSIRTYLRALRTHLPLRPLLSLTTARQHHR